MKQKAWKIMFACAVGAFIGALICLELRPWLIWVGLLAGGLTGYLSYDFRRVLAAIPAAYRAARGWQPDKPFWRAFLVMSLAFFCASSWTVFIFAFLAFLDGQHLMSGILWGTIVILTFSIALGAGFIATQDDKVTRGMAEYEAHFKHLESVAWILIYGLAIPIVIFYHLPRGLWWVTRRTPRAIPVIVRAMGYAVLAVGRGFIAFICFLGRFSWQVFIRIHSDERVLCGTDAMIGAAAGYLLGSAVMGALAGALVGLVNYELVTRRWLIRRGYLAIKAK